MDPLPSFLAAAFALIASPGPNTLSLAAVGAAFGWRRGIGYMVGLDLGMLAVIAIVGSGISGLLFTLPSAARIVMLLAVAYFAYLAYRIATTPPLADGHDTRRPPSWVAAILVSLANPKGYAAMAAMYSGFVLAPHDRFVDGAEKGGMLMALIVIVNVVWLLAGAALTPLFRHPVSNRILNVGFAVALLASLALAVRL